MKINVFFRNNIRELNIYNSYQIKWGDIINIILKKYKISIEEINTIILRNNQTNTDVNISNMQFNDLVIQHEISFNTNSYVFVIYEYQFNECKNQFSNKYINFLMNNRMNNANRNNIANTFNTANTFDTANTINTGNTNIPRLFTRSYTIYPGMNNDNNSNWTELTNNLLSLFNLPTSTQSLLSEDEINQLEHGLYQNIRRDNEPQTQCSISLQDFEDNSNVMRLPCNHLFMETSIRQWLRSNNRCPLCRVEINSSNN